MAGLREYITSAVLIGVFIFAFISFGVQFAQDNDTNVSIIDEDSVNRTYTNIESEIDNTLTDAESQREGFLDSVPLFGELSIVVESIFGTASVFFTTIRNFYNIITDLIVKTIGIPTIVINGILSIVLISLVLLGWRVYRSGQ